MSLSANSNVTSAASAIFGVLRSRANKALFVTELAAALRRTKVGTDEMENALAHLAAEGTVVLRDNFCADPHLANVDLRLVAQVDEASGADAHATALREIDLAWNKWLSEYLANHRCG